MSRIIILAWVAAMAACSAPAAAPATDPTFHVILERGMCLAACPNYRVEIDASGQVTFTGSNSFIPPHVPCQGRHQWRIDPAAVVKLEALVDERRFFAFKDKYEAEITDMPPFTVTVTRNGRTKAVRDYVGQMVGMPKAVAEIEEAIDVAAGDRDCVIARTAATPAQ